MLWLKPFFNYYFYYFLKWTEVQAVMVDKILLEYKKLETSLHGEVDLSYRRLQSHSVWPEILQASFTLKGFLP